MKTHISRNAATARRPGRPILAAMGTAGWAQAEAALGACTCSSFARPARLESNRDDEAPHIDHNAPRADRRAVWAIADAPGERLEIGAVDDPLEHEADRIADEVMHICWLRELAPTSAPVQINRKCTACEGGRKASKEVDRNGRRRRQWNARQRA